MYQEPTYEAIVTEIIPHFFNGFLSVLTVASLLFVWWSIRRLLARILK